VRAPTSVLLVNAGPTSAGVEQPK